MRSSTIAILCVAALLAAAAYAALGNGPADDLDAPGRPAPLPVATAAVPGSTGDLGAALHAARRSGSAADLDRVVAAVAAAAQEQPDDAAILHKLAEAKLERVLLRSQLRGLVAGVPIYTELPPEVAADLEAGMAAAARARELGDDGADLYRIEAALMSHRITGLGSALQWNGRIQQALAAAAERAGNDPQLHVALGLRKLLAPPFLGQDPAQALRHFEFAAAALLDDERPAVFAAMASYVQKKQAQAVAWLERAVQRNPHNRFARAVLARLRAGEPDPFGRDVSAAEAGAAK